MKIFCFIKDETVMFVYLVSMGMPRLVLLMTAVFVNALWEPHPTALLLPVRLTLLRTFCAHVKKVTLESDVRAALMVTMEILLILVTTARDAPAVVT